MPTQGERQNYQWRPNDNSSTTRLRYDLEAEHWLTSLKSASRSGSVGSGGSGSFAFLFTFFALVFNLLNILILALIMLIKWIIGLNKKASRVVTHEEVSERWLTPEEVDEISRNQTPTSIYED
tara:strand:- start:49889 stop:50257 length:369 start_codon:yes stop_codon:yes gene_type:complete